MLSPYRAVLSRPGAAAFSGTGFVARLPMSMVGLGLVLLVSSVTGSYGLAGAVSAVFVAANALLAVVQGRLLDRLGQDRVLTALVLVFTGSLTLTMWSVQQGWPHLVTYAGAALAGATLPAVGSCVRARWSHLLERPAEVQTAYALESVVDEAVFMLGPVLVTVLATSWHPLAGLGSAVLAALIGTLALAAQRATQPPPHPRRADGTRRPRMPWATTGVLAAVALALGMLFGGAEVATVAFSEEQGSTRSSGILLALWAAGSLIAGLVTGVVRWRRGPAVRLRFGAAGLAIAMAPLTLVGSVPVMALALFVGGFAIAPTLIAMMSLVEQVVPRTRLVEGMAVIQTGLAGGVAPGAAVTGALVDAHGASTAYLVPALAGIAAALLAHATPR